MHHTCLGGGIKECITAPLAAAAAPPLPAATYTLHMVATCVHLPAAPRPPACLQRGGETIYNGPIGADASHLIAYFQGIK